MRLAVLALLLFLPPSQAAAQAQITLAEILPALAGSDLGALELGPAPPPGESRVVRRSEVLAALRTAGRDPRGLAIPASTRVRREARALEPEALAELARPAVAEALAPCRVESLSFQHGATLAEGDVEVEVDGSPIPRTGRSVVVVVLRTGSVEVRAPAQAEVECPPPIVHPGQRVSIIARFGAVEASAPGVARQPGRTGDVIRVQSAHSRATLRARVIDAETVEVVR